MKTRFLPWFLFILCTQSVAILGFESFPRSKTEDFNISKPRFGGQLHGMHFILSYKIQIELQEFLLCILHGVY